MPVDNEAIMYFALIVHLLPLAQLNCCHKRTSGCATPNFFPLSGTNLALVVTLVPLTHIDR